MCRTCWHLRRWTDWMIWAASPAAAFWQLILWVPRVTLETTRVTFFNIFPEEGREADSLCPYWMCGCLTLMCMHPVSTCRRMYEEVVQLHVTPFNKCTLNYVYTYTCNLQKMFSPSYMLKFGAQICYKRHSKPKKVRHHYLNETGIIDNTEIYTLFYIH